MKVLLVEDDLVIRSLLKVKINRLFRAEDKNFEIQTAEKLAIALELRNSFSPDVVLLDLGLTDSDSESTAECVNEFAKNSSVIVVSNGLTPDLIYKCYQRGAEDVLDKDLLSSSLLYERILSSYNKHLKSRNPNEVIH